MELLETNFEKLKTRKTEQAHKARKVVLVELLNGDKYEFDLIRRSKENSIMKLWVLG